MNSSDVLIIGGGVIGLSIARELHKSGVRRVTIVERGRVGQEASFAAAGMLAPNAEATSADSFYRFCRDSCGLYPDLADELLEETGVNIELDRSGTLYAAFTEEDSAELAEKHRWQREAGMNVERLSAAETLDAEPQISYEVRESLLYPDDWQVENRKMLAALRVYADRNGIEILENAEVKQLVTENGRVVGSATETERFAAGVTVLATGAWTSLIKIGAARMPFEVKPIRGQMISYRMTERRFKHVVCSPRGYLVPRMDGRVLIGATVEDAGFDKTVTDEGVEGLRLAGTEIAPCLAGLEIDEKWSGLRPFAADGLPVLGLVTGVEDVLIATAHYRNGILLSPQTAKLIAAKITRNESSELFDVFGAGRFERAERAFGQ